MDQLEFPKTNLPQTSTVTSAELKKFGLNNELVGITNTIEDLRKTKPYLILAKCKKNRDITQEMFSKQRLNKGQVYLMGFGIYNQLKNSPDGTKLFEPNTTPFEKYYKPYQGQSLDNKHLLVVRTGGIGDLLFIQPNLIHLKKLYPSCKITMSSGPQYHSMLETWDCIDQVITLPVPLSYVLNADYHAIFEGVIERCNQAKTTNSYRLFTDWLKINLPDEMLIPSQKAKPECVSYVDNILKELNVEPGEFYLFQLRASSPIRTPRPAFWMNLISRLVSEGKKVLITDSPYMSTQIDLFINSFVPEQRSSIFNFCKYSKTLDISIALASKAKIVIAPDSSFTHIAPSLGVPSFGIYGAFLGELRCSTYKNSDWINGKNLNENCAPCFIHGPNPCKNSISGHPVCYDNIDINECINKIKKLTGE